MSRKGENIYKRKDGRWEGRYPLEKESGGKRKYGYVYAYTYRECKDKLYAAKAMIKQQKEKSIITSNTMLLMDVADAWFLIKKPQLKDSTIVKYSILLSTHIIPKLGNRKIEELTKKDIQEYTLQLITSGKTNGDGLAPKTVADILSLLKNIFKYASEFGYNCSPEICSVRIHQDQKVLKVLTLEEQHKLSTYLLESDDLRDIGILVCLFTGLRIGELCALTWNNISIKDETLYIEKTLQRIKIVDADQETDTKTKVIITAPKSTCSIRTIPLPKSIIEVLQKVESKDGYLLTGQIDKYIEPRSMQYHFKRTLIKCEMDPVHFHVLRHTFATRCVELGFDVKTLSELLGHSNVNITLNRYVHPSFELKRESMQRLSQLLSVK